MPLGKVGMTDAAKTDGSPLPTAVVSAATPLAGTRATLCTSLIVSVFATTTLLPAPLVFSPTIGVITIGVITITISGSMLALMPSTKTTPRARLVRAQLMGLTRSHWLTNSVTKSNARSAGVPSVTNLGGAARNSRPQPGHSTSSEVATV
jgi:hypothetical protein